jgi:hypothetical protein
VETLRDIVRETPLFWCITGSGVLALAFQALLMRAALRRRALQRKLRLRAEQGEWAEVSVARVPRRHVEVLAALALLLVPITTVVAVRHAADLAPVAPRLTPGAIVATATAPGPWRAELAAISLGITVAELAGAMAVIAWSLAFASRRQIAGLVRAAAMAPRAPAEAAAWARVPSPETATVVACACATAAMVFLPALHGASSYCALLRHGLGTLGDGDRTPQVSAILLEARRALDAGTAASQVGLGLAAITCAALVWWRSPARARRRVLERGRRHETS